MFYKSELAKSFDSRRNELMKNNDFNGLIELYKEAPGKLAKEWIGPFQQRGGNNQNSMNPTLTICVQYLSWLLSRIDTNNLLKMQALINLRTERKEYSVYATKRD